MMVIQPPKVFVSYSWDDDEHQEWVRSFASRLRADGVDARLDKWHTGPGDNTPEFMEREVRGSDFVLCVCTPRYKERFDARKGGVGYEGGLLTGESLVDRNQQKIIPVLRGDEWKYSAPAWLLGIYYVDLRGEPYTEKNYRELLATLLDRREQAPPIGGIATSGKKPKTDSEFVNRKIELATLDPNKLHKTYWQCALISAPTGYGKTRLVKRLMEGIQGNVELNDDWVCVYVDMRECKDSDYTIRYLVEQITGSPVTSDMDDKRLNELVCSHILEKLSISPKDGTSRRILLVIDSIDFVNSKTVEWFSSVLHDVIVNSYADYEKNNPALIVRVLLVGTDTETFWVNYRNWEEASQKYRLKPPQMLTLSAFDDLPVQELVQYRAAKDNISLENSVIEEISYELQYLSGGHPEVVTDILEELALRRFRQYKDYFKDYREQLIKNYISGVAKKVLRQFPLPQAQKDIKTVCAFRLINLNTLQNLRRENLVLELMDISFLGKLCKFNILKPPNAEKLFYHDDIIRRILYLDLAHGLGKDDEHIQNIHRCARSLYCELMQSSHHSLHLFFVEWLFHSLQVTGLSNEDIILEWKVLLAAINHSELPLDDIKHAIIEKLNNDGDVKYLFHERYGSRDFSPLFES